MAFLLKLLRWEYSGVRVGGCRGEAETQLKAAAVTQLRGGVS